MSISLSSCFNPCFGGSLRVDTHCRVYVLLVLVEVGLKVVCLYKLFIFSELGVFFSLVFFRKTVCQGAFLKTFLNIF